MPNPNMTNEELQKQIYQLTDSFLVESKDQNGNERSLDTLNQDRHLFVAEAIQLFATFMDNLLTNAVVEKNFTKEVDAYIKKVRAEFGSLTIKNTEEDK